MMFGEGISSEGEVLDIAENANIINKSGAWYSFGDVRMGQGRENSKQFLRDNPDIFGEIVLKVKKALGMLNNETPAPAAEAKVAEDKKKPSRK